jgi:cytoskeletal protein RodZ
MAMHGMLSLGVLVAAFVGLAGWTGYLSVRLYRTCPAGQTQPPTPDTATARTSEATSAPGPRATEATPAQADAPGHAQHAPGSHPVA